MTPEVVIAVYRPKPGGEGALRQMIARHVPLLLRVGLATHRPRLLLRSQADGSYLEIFEWKSAQAARDAHVQPEVEALWSEMAGVCDFRTLGDLAESAQPFPHFEPVDDVAATRDAGA